jgi:hypothetical protein
VRVVVRYANGRVFKGFVATSVRRSAFTLWLSPTASDDERDASGQGPQSRLLRARPGRDPAYVRRRPSSSLARPPGRGDVPATKFSGTTLGYRADAHSFFLSLVDPRSNNLRVFIVMSAVRYVRFPGTTGIRCGTRRTSSRRESVTCRAEAWGSDWAEGPTANARRQLLTIEPLSGCPTDAADRPRGRRCRRRRARSRRRWRRQRGWRT